MGPVAATFCLLAALASIGARAQGEADMLRTLAGRAPDLSLPVEALATAPSDGAGMALYRPAGSGPFPALVIVHSCGGIRAEINGWAREAQARGYVALVLDAFSQRRIKSVCVPSRDNAAVNFPRGAKDALQAVAHLAGLPFVDPQRIGVLGFSWGGTVGLLSDGQGVAESLSGGAGPAAVVAFYPLCFLPARATASGRDAEFVRPDLRAPLLVLLAGQDTEAPAGECSTRLQRLKDQGRPVDWHEYATATHCWDCSSLDGLSKTDFLGHAVVYRHDKAATADSLNRTFEFFDARLKPR